MADMPRQYFGLPLQPRVRLVLALLWSYVPGRREGTRHFVWHTTARLAELLGVGKRAVETCLSELYEAGLVVSGEQGGRWGFWLVDGLAGAPDDSDEAAASTSGSRPVASKSDRRSPITLVQEGSEIADHFGAGKIGDRRSLSTRTPINSARVKEELDELEDLTRAAAAAGGSSGSPSDLRTTAAQLLAQLATAGAYVPVDAAGQVLRSRQLLASDRRTVELLAQLLDVPTTGPERAGALLERRDYVQAQIVAFAAVCRADAGQARWWGPGMLSTLVQGRVSPWAALEATVEAAQRAAAEVTGAQAAAAAAVEAKREQAKREQAKREATELEAGRLSSLGDFAAVAKQGGNRFGDELASILASRMRAVAPTDDVEAQLAEHRRKVERLRQQQPLGDAG